MSSINAISVALQGLLKAQERVAQSAERVAGGDVSADSLVQMKLDALDVKTQTKSLKVMSDLEDQALDLLA